MKSLTKTASAAIAILFAGTALTGCTATEADLVTDLLDYITETETPEPVELPLPEPTVEYAPNELLDGLTVEPAGLGDDYLRTEYFGDPWIDVDQNGCDTRNDILNRDLTQVVYKYVDDTCTVQYGTLNDPYTGAVIDFERGPNSADVQIDHLLPLKYVWIHGGKSWTQEQREAIANDPANLYAVDGPTNSSKGAKGPENWMPPVEAFHCQYATDFVGVASKYGVSITSADKRALQDALATCGA